MSNLQLIEAVKAEDAATVKELIAAGADVNQEGEQEWTPLNFAAGKGNLEIVKLLVENGADVFKVGRDLRTPYMIALAAGRVEVVKYLKEVEEQVDPERARASHPTRKYSKAYHLGDLRKFSGWSESKINWKEKETNGAGDEFTDDKIVFIHQDHTVTESMWHNENVIFNQVTPEWETFCAEVLNFSVPDDLSLIVASGNAG